MTTDMAPIEIVERNLVEFFRHIARVRRGELAELDGIWIASAGIQFHMFNTAFFSDPSRNASRTWKDESARRSGASAPWDAVGPFGLVEERMARGLSRSERNLFSPARTRASPTATQACSRSDYGSRPARRPCSTSGRLRIARADFPSATSIPSLSAFPSSGAWNCTTSTRCGGPVSRLGGLVETARLSRRRPRWWPAAQPAFTPWPPCPITGAKAAPRRLSGTRWRTSSNPRASASRSCKRLKRAVPLYRRMGYQTVTHFSVFSK